MTKRVAKTAVKKDDYTRLQNLNALFSVIGSASTREETLQLQRTLSFLRENDEMRQMPVKSFEHCIEQVVRFHFPNKRNLNYTTKKKTHFCFPKENHFKTDKNTYIAKIYLQTE